MKAITVCLICVASVSALAYFDVPTDIMASNITTQPKEIVYKLSPGGSFFYRGTAFNNNFYKTDCHTLLKQDGTVAGYFASIEKECSVWR